MGSSLELERQRVNKLGREKFIKELVHCYSKDINKLSVIEIIKDHLEYNKECQDLKMLNKIRKMNTKDARKLYIDFYYKGLNKKTFEELMAENI